MRQILYVSSADRDIAAAALAGILARSRANNLLLGVTGLLLHIDGGFLQILEGEERAVRDLYSRIAADRRHWNSQIMLDREAPRAFAGWSMGMERPRPDDAQTAGIFAVTQEAVARRLSPGAGKVVATMLQTFYRVQKDSDPGFAKTG